MDRRAFIGSGIALGSSVILASLVVGQKLQRRPRLILGHTEHYPIFSSPGIERYSSRTTGSIIELDLGSGRRKSIKVPLWAHGFAFSGEIAASLQKWGDLAVVVDLSQSRIVREISAPHGSVFFGHCCFLQNNRFLAFSAQGSSGLGQILIYDTRDGSLSHKIDLSRRVHEIQAYSDHEILAALNANDKFDRSVPGQEGRLDIIDVATGEVRKSSGIAQGGHILQMGDDQFLVSGQLGDKLQTPITFLDWKSGQRSELKDVQQISAVGEGLSVGLLDRGVAAVTCPDARKILVWNIPEKKSAWLEVMKQPRGLVALTNGRFLINYGNNQLLEYRYDRQANSIELVREVAAHLGNGLHIYQRPIS